MLNLGFYNRPGDWTFISPAEGSDQAEPVRQARPEPAGAVQQQAAQAWKTPVAPMKRTGRRGRRGAVLLFCLCLLVIGTVTAITSLAMLQGMPELWPPVLDGSTTNDTAPYRSKPSDPPDTDEPTTIKRASVGDGTTLLIATAQESPITFQEIYRRSINSIVSVRGVHRDSLSQGTGVIMSADGYIITNSHVIEGCSKVEIILEDEARYAALLVGYDKENDLAVLKIDAQGLSAAQFGDSNALQVGDLALAIGNPLGERFRGTMTDGIISAINRGVLVDGKNQVYIQTTAALNSGNSGGALLNEYGQVVGITSMKMTSNYDTIEGLGFAIPMGTVKAVVDELIEKGYVGGRPTIGVTVYTLTAEAASQAGVSYGIMVEDVEEQSDAWAQGLRPGDIILEANGEPVRDANDLNVIKQPMEVGDIITMRVWRDGKARTVKVKLVEQYTLSS